MFKRSHIGVGDSAVGPDFQFVEVSKLPRPNQASPSINVNRALSIILAPTRHEVAGLQRGAQAWLAMLEYPALDNDGIGNVPFPELLNGGKGTDGQRVKRA